MTQLAVICGYLCALVALAVVGGRAFRGTSQDYFVASRSIGPAVLMLSVFGTAMTAFSLVGSTGEAYRTGIGVYGLMASSSGVLHSAVFFFVGLRMWSIGARHGYTTQIQFFRERFESGALGLMLFPVLAGLVVPYVLIGLLGAGSVVGVLTEGAFPGLFASTGGAVPPWLTGLVITTIVSVYVFAGGLRAAAWANSLQAGIFLVTGVATFLVIAPKLGGVQTATEAVLAASPERLVREGSIGQLQFLSYCLIPLSIGMFPHVYQHWLTARSAASFKPMLVLHPVCTMLVWLPCVLIGVWAVGATLPDGSAIVPAGSPPNGELGLMVRTLTTPLLGGLLGAGILAAIMSSLDSQLLAIGSMFTNDVAIKVLGRDRLGDRERVLLGRSIVLAVALAAYLCSLGEPRSVFTLGVWCFSAYSSLFPIAVAAIYWKRATRHGAIAAVAATVIVGGLLFREGAYGADPAYLFHGMLPVVPMIAASTAALVIGSLATTPPSRSTLVRFFPE